MRKSLPHITFIVVLAFAVAAVVMWRLANHGSALAETDAKPDQRRPDIVLISIDTLRADHLGTYGYFRPTSPNLDRLAAESIVFEKAFTVMSHTLPAHISLMTGVHPATHNVLSNHWKYTGPFVTLARRLKDAGYATGGFVTGFPLKAESGMARGFDVYEDTAGSDGSHLPKMPGEIANQRAAEWLGQKPEGPVFLFIHYFDVHASYHTPPTIALPFKVDAPLLAHMKELKTANVSIEQISPSEIKLDGKVISDLPTAVNAYDNQIYHVDVLIARLLDVLKSKGRLNDTLLIILSDHGEGLGQHGYYSHGLYLYEEQLRIPLIVRHFGSDWQAKRVRSAVSLLDIVPTILELLGLPGAPPQLHGRSLLTLMQTQRELPADRWLLAQRRTFSKKNLRTRGSFASNVPLHAVRGDDRLKYLKTGDGTEELYDLLTDPYELTNLARERPQDCSRLRTLLEKTRDRYKVNAADSDKRADEETRRVLKSLGYVE